MGDENVVTSTELEIWERLLNDQTSLFQRTVARNNELEIRVEELERELSVWKAALKTADEDKKTLSKTVVQLERSIGSLRDDNPLILCLIDGDGNIFSSELLSTGQAGGRQAAMLLTKGLTDHLASTDSLDAALPGRGQLWLTIYCNKSGLVETLTHNNVCTAEQFDAFCAGFNQASPLFSIVDVGNGKEAADAKIKECLRVFTRFPQTSKVFFGGAHDNGYTSTLTYLQNEGLLDKIILLRGYKDLAYEIKGLELPHLDIQGLFMTKRLQTHSSKKNNVPNQAAPPTPQHDTDKTRGKAPTPPSRNSASPVKKSKQVEPDQLLSKLKPLPCNFYYLAECKQGENCRFAHDYVLSPEQINSLREAAKNWPCPFVNRGSRCFLGDDCVMGHVCPKGARCSFAKQGKCKFVANNAHSWQDPRMGHANMSPRTTASSPGASGLHLSPLASPSAASAFLDVPEAVGPQAFAPHSRKIFYNGSNWTQSMHNEYYANQY